VTSGCTLGRAAIAVNQGLPAYLVDYLDQRFGLANLTVGVLSMAFNAGSDDTRASLSYLLADLLAARSQAVLCTDPLVSSDPKLLPLDTDIWNLLGRGVLP
jgi:UDP-N-acetyl-D-mannosaminuronic acid dehydrogenase